MGSIMRGIQALKDGLIWRVGNGEQIILTRVSELTDPSTGDWDSELAKSNSSC